MNMKNSLMKNITSKLSDEDTTTFCFVIKNNNNLKKRKYER